MPETKILVCPQGFRTKGEAQKALATEVEKCKSGQRPQSWGALRLYFCGECRRYHVWPRHTPRPLDRKAVKVAIEQLIETFNGSRPESENGGRNQQHPSPVPAPAAQ